MNQQATRKGYKQTELGELPQDWNVLDIEGISSEVGDGIHSTPRYSSSGEYYFVNGNNIRNGSIVITENTKRVGRSEFQKLKKNLSERTLFLSINGTIGNVAFYNQEPIILGKSAAYINVAPRYSLPYIYYCFHSKSTAEHFAYGLTGTTIKNLGLGTIRSTPIPMPTDYQEQSAIANALSDTDALINSLEKLINKKRAIKTATMQQLLTGKTRLPEFDKYPNGKPKGTKQTELGEIPEDWTFGRLGDLLAYEQPTSYLVSDTEYSEVGDVPVLTAGKTFILGYTHEKHGIYNQLPVIIFDDFTTASKFVDFKFKAKSSAMKMLKPRRDDVDLRFVFLLMSTIDFPLGDHKRHWIGEFQKLELPIPANPVEQTAIANVVADMDGEIKDLVVRLDKTRQIKQGMMQELLTGRTRLV